MIPKVIHYIYKDLSGSNQLQPLHELCIASVLNQVRGTDYKVIMHNESGTPFNHMIKELDEMEYSKIPQSYYDEMDQIGIKNHAHQSDFVRFSLLNDIGGVYLDTDIIMTNDLISYLDEVTSATVLFRQSSRMVCNGAMICSGDSPMLSHILETYRINYQPSKWSWNSMTVMKEYLSKITPSDESIYIEKYESGCIYPHFNKFDEIVLSYFDNDKNRRLLDGALGHHLWRFSNDTTVLPALDLSFKIYTGLSSYPSTDYLANKMYEVIKDLDVNVDMIM